MREPTVGDLLYVSRLLFCALHRAAPLLNEHCDDSDEARATYEQAMFALTWVIDGPPPPTDVHTGTVH